MICYVWYNNRLLNGENKKKGGWSGWMGRCTTQMSSNPKVADLNLITDNFSNFGNALQILSMLTSSLTPNPKPNVAYHTTTVKRNVSY